MKSINTSALLLLCMATVNAQHIHVPADLSNIQAAINYAAEGDTIIVEDGIYLENINFRGKAITVASRFILDGDRAHIPNTIIDGNQPSHPDSASTVIMCSGEDTSSVLMGFTITGGKGSMVMAYWGTDLYLDYAGGGICIVNSGGKICHNIIERNQLLARSPSDYVHGGGIYANVNHQHRLIIRDNIVRLNRSEGKYVFGAGIDLVGGPMIVENNLITKNILNTSGNPNGTGLNWANISSQRSSSEIIIRNNIISENIGKSNGMTSMGGSVSFYNIEGDARVQFSNNIVADNYSDAKGGGLYLFHTNIRIYNNTIVNNESGTWGNNIFMQGASDIVVYNNIIWSDIENGKPDFHIEGGYALHAYYNILKRPLVRSDKVNAEYNTYINPLCTKRPSYQLTKNSPALGRGVASLLVDGTRYFAPKTDIKGNLRPNAIDPHVDLGAYESEFRPVILSNAKLISIQQPGCRLHPSFSNDLDVYEMHMPKNFIGLSDLFGIPRDFNSSVDINQAQNIFSQNKNDRTATLTVTSADGTEKKSYSVVFTPLSIETRLNYLSVSEGELNPAWHPDTFSYVVNLPVGSTHTPSITCTPFHEHATYDVYTAWDIGHAADAYRRSVVTVTSEFGEPYTKKYKVLFNVGSTLSNEGYTDDGRLKAYPNPISTELNLEWDPGEVIHKIVLTNALGQMVRAINHPRGSSVTIKRGNLPSGFYFIKVYAEKTSVIKVLVK